MNTKERKKEMRTERGGGREGKKEEEERRKTSNKRTNKRDFRALLALTVPFIRTYISASKNSPTEDRVRISRAFVPTLFA